MDNVIEFDAHRHSRRGPKPVATPPAPAPIPSAAQLGPDPEIRDTADTLIAITGTVLAGIDVLARNKNAWAGAAPYLPQHIAAQLRELADLLDPPAPIARRARQ